MTIPNDDPESRESRYWDRARAMEHARHLREIHVKEQIVLNAEDLRPGPPCTCGSPHSSVIFHSLGQTHTWCPRSFWATRAMARCRPMTQEERAKWLQAYPLTKFLELFALPASDASTSLATTSPVRVTVFQEDLSGWST